MADPKPSIVARWEPGRLVTEFPHLCATENWVYSCWANLRGGDGISVTKVEEGQPQVKLNLEIDIEGYELTYDGNGKAYIRKKVGSSGEEEGQDRTVPRPGGGNPSPGGGSDGTAGGSSLDDAGRRDNTTCNTWSSDLQNGDEDELDNRNEDNCRTLNGWS